MSVFQTLLTKARGQGAGHLILLDPDKTAPDDMAEQCQEYEAAGVDGILMGGSLVSADGLDPFVSAVKEACRLPVFLFPGGSYQLSRHADGLLFLSLLSGRNPHYLIGEQVIAAPRVMSMGLESIGTGYLLIDGGAQTSVSFMSNTQPIPADKPDLAVAHAMAARLLGFGCLYLEAGSGALNPVPLQTVAAVKAKTNLPLIVGGGIRTPEAAGERARAGADFIVTGTVFEEDNSQLLKAMTSAIHWKSS